MKINRGTLLARKACLRATRKYAEILAFEIDGADWLSKFKRTKSVGANTDISIAFLGLHCMEICEKTVHSLFERCP